MIGAITAEAAGSDQIKSFFVLKVRDGAQGLTAEARLYASITIFVAYIICFSCA